MTRQASAEELRDEAKKTEFDITILTSLLKTGLIARVTWVNVPRNGYVLTPAGAQFVADYKKTQQALDNSSRSMMLPAGVSLSASTVQETIEFLTRLEPETLTIQPQLDPAQVCLLIPALNEAEHLHDLLSDLTPVIPANSQIIVIDGGSTDATTRIASAMGSRVIIQKGFGKGDALRQAFMCDCENCNKRVVVLMDADGSNRPEEIPQLLLALANGADIAKGSRFMKGGGSTDISLVRRIGNKIFVSIVNLAWHGKYTDLCYGFMALQKDTLQKLRPLLESKRFQIETEMCIKARKLGLKVVEIPSIELRRRGGISKLHGVRDSTQIFRTIIRELLSD